MEMSVLFIYLHYTTTLSITEMPLKVNVAKTEMLLKLNCH